jgi:plasmid stability protein
MLSIASIMEELWRTDQLATLNIKNLPDTLYKKLQAQAKRERRSVAQEVTRLLAEALGSPKRLSILNLKGLGKEHWQGTGAIEHVDKERSAWD